MFFNTEKQRKNRELPSLKVLCTFGFLSNQVGNDGSGKLIGRNCTAHHWAAEIRSAEVAQLPLEESSRLWQTEFTTPISQASNLTHSV
jgi:hypothetical protein